MSSTDAVNLVDPEDLKTQIKRFEAQRADQETALSDIQKQIERTDAYLTHFRGLLRLAEVEIDGTDLSESEAHEGKQTFPTKTDTRSAVGVTEACIRLLESGPMNLNQLLRGLSELGIEPKNRNALNATLYTAASKGRIKRLGSGVYGPLKSQGLEQAQM